MKRFRFVLVLLLGVLALACSTAYKSLIAAMPDLSEMADGVYRGEYDVESTPVKASVDVTVQEQRITAIAIVKHQRSPVGKKAEKIVDRVIEMQSLDVDVVSGATASSKALLKAVENALQQ